MNKVLVILVLGALAYAAHQRGKQADYAPPQDESAEFVATDVEVDTTEFKCDGRKYCSQMTSCAEATYFLQNCPGVKMDGDNGGRGDGIPCERQWCGSH